MVFSYLVTTGWIFDINFSCENSVTILLTCREAPVTYHEDVALEDTWHENVGTLGLNLTMVSRLAKWYLG